MKRHRRGTMLGAAGVLVAAALASNAARAGDPTTADCLAANETALALHGQHKLRDERAKLLVCAANSCPADVRAECVRRVSDVNLAIPTIVFEARDPAGSDLGAVKVTMDGEPLAERLEGTALSIDPGTHTFAFETAGQPRVEKQLLIREGEKDRRERVAFGAPPEAGEAGSVPGATLTATATPAAEPPSRFGTQRIVAIVAAAVGVVGVGLGAGFGLDATSKHDDAQKACPSSACPDQRGVDLWNQAHTAGNVSTVAFIVGGVGLAAGAALWLTGKPEAAASSIAAPQPTQVGLGPGTLQVRGTW